MVQEEWSCSRPSFDSAERRHIYRANGTFPRPKKLLHNRDEQFIERYVAEAAQGARWLREVVKR